MKSKVIISLFFLGLTYFVYLIFPSDLDDFLKTRYFTIERDKIKNKSDIDELKELHDYYESLNPRNSLYRLRNKSFKKIYKTLRKNGKNENSKIFVISNYKNNHLNFSYAEAVMQILYDSNNNDSIDYYFDLIESNFTNQNMLWEKHLKYYQNDSIKYKTLFEKYWSSCSPIDFVININNKSYYADYYLKKNNNYTAIFENSFTDLKHLEFELKKYSKGVKLKPYVRINGEEDITYLKWNEEKFEANFASTIPKCRIIEVKLTVENI